jgi:uncharacterized protein (UPF0548 family)
VEPLGLSRRTATPWRIGRGWSQAEIEAALAALSGRGVSFPDLPDAPTSTADTPLLTPGPGWTLERFQALLEYEPTGRPLLEGRFAIARQAIPAYRMADPRITRGHVDPGSPLLGRTVLVEIRVLAFRFLAGPRVGAVLDDAGAERTRFGIRLDTLEGHLLHGSEWIVVEKDHPSGAVRLRIEVRSRHAPLPAWWMTPGYRLFGETFRARWRRQAARRLRALH